MRESENSISERIASRRILELERPGTSAEDEEVIRDVLVAREMARVDLGVDLLVAQPRQ